MTIEEISKAKREAEAHIQQELQQLQEKTGMHISHVDVSYTETMSLWLAHMRRVVTAVQIELRVP